MVLEFRKCSNFHQMFLRIIRSPHYVEVGTLRAIGSLQRPSRPEIACTQYLCCIATSVSALSTGYFPDTPYMGFLEGNINPVSSWLRGWKVMTNSTSPIYQEGEGKRIRSFLLWLWSLGRFEWGSFPYRCLRSVDTVVCAKRICRADLRHRSETVTSGSVMNCSFQENV